MHKHKEKRNEDYMSSQEYVNRRARIICGHDGGVCNPRKAKEYAEAEDQAKRELW